MEWKGPGPAAAHTAIVYARVGGDSVPWSPDMGASGFVWTAVCTCGWASGNHYHPPEHGLARAWGEHVRREVPELRLHEIAAESDDSGPLTTEVRVLRSQGVSWERIATAVGITRQSAHRRWRHVETELAAITTGGPSADLARLRGALSHLAAVVDVHDDARPEIQILYGIVTAGEQVAAALARTPEESWHLSDDLSTAAAHLEDAMVMAHRQVSRQGGAATVDSNQVLDWGGRIELVLDETARTPEEGPVYFVTARAFDATDASIAVGSGDTVSGALAALTSQDAPAEVSSTDLPLDPPF
ncbi:MULTISPECIES: hypothetical protein [Nocardiopsis]|uniref:Uncharacterized protein n=1 Tax=Nocardiopsis sinuspersici TaxID=501010 RepID=A0A1V3BVB2_9ACTN|nr:MULTISPECIES: hypothetical protein [Nocardiopsis]OOC52435.1 hypothetical protein NOSIN_00120 [Nocardiopsis sinuspersici]